MANYEPWCECGRPKAPLAWACERCKFLDAGGHMSRYDVVTSLRNGPATIADVARSTGRSGRSVLRCLQDLIAIGRVHRIGYVDVAAEQRPGNPPGLYGLVSK